MSMQDAFNQLSPEEVDLLNSDPKMLDDFRKKYGSSSEPWYQKVANVENKIGDKVNQAIGPAVQRATDIIKQTNPVANLGLTAQEQLQKLFNMGGQKAAEALATGAPNRMALPPELSAGIGTAIQMTPDIAAAAQGIGSMSGLSPAPALQDLRSLGRMATTPITEGADKLRNLARVLTGPGEASQRLTAMPLRNAAQDYVTEAQQGLNAAKQIPLELSQARAELPQLQAKMAQLGPEREALVAKAGKNIQALESPLGDLESQKIQMLVNSPEARQATLKQLTELSSKGPDAINAKMTAMDIRQMRQFVQEVARNPEIAIEAPQASQINTALGEAMDKHIPGYKDALDVYKEASAALEDVPNVKAQQLGDLRSRIKSMQDTFTNTQRSAADNVKRAQLNARQIIQKADQMVAEGKLSDVYRQRLYKGIIATGILGFGGKILKQVGGY